VSDQIEKMREARNKPQRYLLQYINLRSRVGDSVFITVFEGKEDIPVYDVWMSRIAGHINFEPTQMNGKENVLNLFDQVSSSNEVANDRVLFFVDSDFDNTKGRAVNFHLYVTNAYSIENYVVNSKAFEKILTCDLGMIGDLQSFRAQLVKIFESRKVEFNRLVAPINAYLRWLRLESGQEISFPDSIGKAISVDLEKIELIIDSSLDAMSGWVGTAVFPTEEIFNSHLGELENLDLSQWGRGKFLFDFMRKIVAAAYNDSRSVAPKYFPKTDRTRADPTVDLLRRAATYTAPPVCLEAFVKTYLTSYL
jgi:hypothetical protein